MNDIDYDELDRAVNSLNSDLSANEATPQAIDEPEAANSVSAPAPLAARRSSGRFMDVVHPSSDMRSSMPLSIPQRNNVSTTPNNIQSEPVTSAADDLQPKTEMKWPDPIDMKIEPVEPVSTDTPAPEAEVDDIDKISDDIDKTLNIPSEPDLAATSPFLTDTKVEKRPLGAFSAEPAPATTASTSTNTNANASEFASDLPAELSKDLLSIEASSTTNPETAENEAVSEPKSATIADMDIPIAQSDATSAAKSNPISSEGPSVSINQQYKEQANTGDQTTGAIYDTASYHKAALSHSAKKKPGILWVLLIILLIIVGVGGGVAAYFLFLAK